MVERRKAGVTMVGKQANQANVCKALLVVSPYEGSAYSSTPTPSPPPRRLTTGLGIMMGVSSTG